MTTDKTRFETAQLSGVEGYKLLTGLVVPRPIGWIGSVSADGVHNLAPYSFFNAVSGNPPMVVFSAGHGDGVRKDTADNVKATGEFTVNIVTDTTVEAMNATSASLPPEVDEFEQAGLPPADSMFIKPKRVAEAKAQLECRLVNDMHIGAEGAGNWLFVGEVVAFWVDTDLLDGTRVDQAKLAAIGRHAGNFYSTTENLFEIVRPA